jgi:hypothetical protein
MVKVKYLAGWFFLFNVDGPFQILTDVYVTMSSPSASMSSSSSDHLHFPDPNAIAVQRREKCRSKAEIREEGGPEEGEVQEQRTDSPNKAPKQLGLHLPRLAPMGTHHLASRSWHGDGSRVPAAARSRSCGVMVELPRRRGRVPRAGRATSGVVFQPRSVLRPDAFPFCVLERRSLERGSPHRPVFPVTPNRPPGSLQVRQRLTGLL